MGWWRSVAYGPLAWYDIDDLIAEIRFVPASRTFLRIFIGVILESRALTTVSAVQPQNRALLIRFLALALDRDMQMDRKRRIQFWVHKMVPWKKERTRLAVL